MDYKEKILEKVEERIKNKIEPDPNFTTERTNMGYWLEYLYDIAFLAGEMSGIRAAKNIMEGIQTRPRAKMGETMFRRWSLSALPGLYAWTGRCARCKS